ncbi:hypothetical protein NtRootA4_37120 [Arthrobacter sp. NtRootA4]|nr:hypothetical protein NtRootA2_39330 [Arthrobacter sp. NtRootA2]BCW16733.1 hypothetical protein NtRootA4_37120 [Arthrobacter sp. NtRootA4]BCW25066.1 hypothetical protein NtRootC7_39330 [Arthrobacter sp. NtRootC7]BCW29335.1 hypothetical protein NtRootC45_39350 [Arthrobacter sp. NtRootC45]BCW33606.1 hypothetical protein NtRootD5_39370 [Arthrobacter sp. NtRootD5]
MIKALPHWGSERLVEVISAGFLKTVPKIDEAIDVEDLAGELPKRHPQDYPPARI